jgi:hypothetical protein
MNDKKKVMILAALGVILLGAGGYSLLGGGSAPAPAPTAKHTPKEGEATATADIKTSGPGEGAATGTPTPDATKPATTTESGNAAIGPDGTKSATAPVPDGTKPGPDGKPQTGTPGANPSEGSVSLLVDPALVAAAKLPVRDPFNGTRWDLDSIARAKQEKQVPTPNTVPNTVRRPKSMGSKPFSMPPMGVDPGQLQGTLPNVGQGGQVGMPSIDDVPYTVTGVVRGSHPAVVVKDASGNQRIVQVGHKLDADTEVLGVARGKMIVRHRGKVKTISIEDAGAAPNKGGTKPPQNQ